MINNLQSENFFDGHIKTSHYNLNQLPMYHVLGQSTIESQAAKLGSMNLQNT